MFYKSLNLKTVHRIKYYVISYNILLVYCRVHTGTRQRLTWEYKLEERRKRTIVLSNPRGLTVGILLIHTDYHYTYRTVQRPIYLSICIYKITCSG